MSLNGMKSVGYEYIGIDGGWWNGTDEKIGSYVRDDQTNRLLWSEIKFPQGGKALVDYIHTLGFKFFGYTDAGIKFCNQDQNASWGHEELDAQTFADWEWDMLKIDSCGLPTSTHGYLPDGTFIPEMWRKHLNATGRPVALNICHIGCGSGEIATQVSDCYKAANSWRSYVDVDPTWSGVIFWEVYSLVGKGMYSRPGGWNDPDAMEVGNMDNGTLGMDKSVFSLFCVLSAPLIAGNDILVMKQETLDVLTNEEAIAINQHWAGHAGDRIFPTTGEVGRYELNVWVKSHGVAEWFSKEGDFEKLFKGLDKDNNGGLSQKEIARFHRPRDSCPFKELERIINEFRIFPTVPHEKPLRPFHEFFLFDGLQGGYNGQIYAKPLLDGAVAVVLFNVDNRPVKNIGFQFSDLVWETMDEKNISRVEQSFHVRDLWDHKDLGAFDSNFVVDLNNRSCKFIKLTPINHIRTSRASE